MSSPHFAVGHDIDPTLLLHAERLVNRGVFNALEFASTELATFPLQSRLLQVSWP